MTLLGWFVGLTLFALFATGGNVWLSVAFGALYAVGWVLLKDREP